MSEAQIRKLIAMVLEAKSCEEREEVQVVLVDIERALGALLPPITGVMGAAQMHAPLRIVAHTDPTL